jgi:type IV secretion system protein VirD4
MPWEDDLQAALPRGLEDGDDRIPGAHWAAPDSLGASWDYQRGSVLLGYRDGKALGSSDDRHLLLVAGSRAGKGVSFIIPNLLLYEGSVLAIDPKGELARITAARRAQGLRQQVFVLDPFGVSGEGTLPWRAKFNPLAEIDPSSGEAIDDAALLADALIELDESGEKHWTYAARDLVRGLILYALLQPPEHRTLSHVRDFFRVPNQTVNGEQVSGQILRLIEMTKHEQEFEGVIAATAHSLLAKNDREFASIVSAADVQLSFLDSPPLRQCLDGSSFALADLKTRHATVYLCLPAGRMGTHAKWLRMIVTLAMLMCERVQIKPEPPLLLLLDEFPVLGHMRALEVAAGQIAGFGVRIWTVLQDVTQLQRHYKEGWETFFGNSGTSIFFGLADNTTLEYVSKKLGTIGYDIRKASSAAPSARLAGAKLIDHQLQHTRLLEPHELELIFAREGGRALVLSPGLPPLIVERAHYEDLDGHALGGHHGD